MTHMKGRAADKYHVVNDFGAIGSGLPAAIGIAQARGDDEVMLVEGDGSLMMHVQELKTIRRHGIRLLISVINDGGYGAEFHKLRAHGVDPAAAIHGRADLAGVATGFGLRSAAVTEMGRFAPLFREHQAANIGTLWDIHTDDLIPSRTYRRVHNGEAWGGGRPSDDRLPSLRAVAIFVAAGRALSFTEAAKAVNLTPSAVSRRIRDLEREHALQQPAGGDPARSSRSWPRATRWWCARSGRARRTGRSSACRPRATRCASRPPISSAGWQGGRALGRGRQPAARRGAGPRAAAESADPDRAAEVPVDLIGEPDPDLSPVGQAAR